MHTLNTTNPSIGLMGFGAFGRLIARHLRPHCRLLAFDPTLPADATSGGIIAADPAEIAACDIVILAVPVAALSEAIATLRPHLGAGAIVVDVGSVKIGPAMTMLAQLPEDVEIVGTHPLFGPQSGRDGIAGLKIAICPIRGRSAWRIAAFLRRMLRLKVIMTTPEAHDREAAMVQGLTHLIAKILVRMEPLPRRMTTASFDLLMRATEMVRHDSPGVFLAIEQANPHARPVRDRFFALAEEMRAHLDRDRSPANGTREALQPDAVS
ncbi:MULTISPECIES: prephenate dehydrogenase [unclassified Bosea (in: a-proteobacteria)]|uniref:prephenate dehydrogenase n=1 Tax=unclassified Bosea (in: a-proteobacteria) TaxID=2653178 RepID=UPI000F75C8F4|nr:MULTISPECIES: prephenate dehydrogenase [unclassified Bosea (in: a-proteobacteria)]AZO76286.1 prephenate dehydrogenase [Bosea sp. Tri-49]RXT26214.1 prephenate dehydrogenase [Bosea sp. Tri-39]RXT31456.1 prephenate dehydrogenase [Bosea sp. Tri-54]